DDRCLGLIMPSMSREPGTVIHSDRDNRALLDIAPSVARPVIRPCLLSSHSGRCGGRRVGMIPTSVVIQKECRKDLVGHSPGGSEVGDGAKATRPGSQVWGSTPPYPFMPSSNFGHSWPRRCSTAASIRSHLGCR